MLALGVHAFFEGLALGILQEMTGFVALLAAVVFHKWAESLAVGIGLLRNEVKSL